MISFSLAWVQMGKKKSCCCTVLSRKRLNFQPFNDNLRR